MNNVKTVISGLLLMGLCSSSFASPAIVLVPGVTDCSTHWSNYCGWPLDPFYDPSEPLSSGGTTFKPGAASPKTDFTFNWDRKPSCIEEQRWADMTVSMIIQNNAPMGKYLPIPITDKNFQPGHFWAKYEVDGIGSNINAAGEKVYFTYRMHYMWLISGGWPPYQVKMKNSEVAGCVGTSTPLSHP